MCTLYLSDTTTLFLLIQLLATNDVLTTRQTSLNFLGSRIFTYAVGQNVSKFITIQSKCGWKQNRSFKTQYNIQNKL